MKTTNQVSRWSWVGLLVLGMAACTAPDARQGCDRQYPRPSDAEACVMGATEVGPRHSTIKEADTECQARYGLKNIPASIPQDSPEYFDQVVIVADQYNACHYAAGAHLYTVGAQDLRTLQSEGCVRAVTPHGMSCE